MNQKALNKVLLKLSLSVIALTVFAYFLRLELGDIMIANASSTAVFFSTIGSMYALITAFVLVEVWGQYNALDSALASEAKVLTSLWNYTDYLNDDKVSKAMHKAIINYIDVTTGKEIQMMGQNQPIKHPSPELTDIMKVIDSIQFNDPRDASAFKSIIQSFENLSTMRMSRISQGKTRLPTLLEAFFELVSFTFLGSYMLQVYANTPLYILSTAVLAAIVIFVRHIILDLDNPFDGIWCISTETYQNARDYINASHHGK